MLVALALVAGATVPVMAQSMSNDKAMADKGMAMMGPKSGTFTGAKGHTASGGFTISGTGKDRKLEFSDSFRADKAPDSYVILAKGGMGDAPGSLELGKLKKDSGAQSYKIPESADLAQFTSVVIWSKGHHMAVGQASLAGGSMDHGAMGSMDHGSMDKGTMMDKPAMAGDTGMMKSMAKDSGMMKKP
jgi:hypothetical protein